MPYCTSYFKFLFEWFWGFPEQNKDFAIQNMGKWGVSFFWALLRVFLVLSALRSKVQVTFLQSHSQSALHTALVLFCKLQKLLHLILPLSISSADPFLVDVELHTNVCRHSSCEIALVAVRTRTFLVDSELKLPQIRNSLKKIPSSDNQQRRQNHGRHLMNDCSSPVTFICFPSFIVMFLSSH